MPRQKDKDWAEQFDPAIGQNKNARSAGFEPTRETPNWFLVSRLNHSATTGALVYIDQEESTPNLVNFIYTSLFLKLGGD